MSVTRKTVTIGGSAVVVAVELLRGREAGVGRGSTNPGIEAGVGTEKTKSEYLTLALFRRLTDMQEEAGNVRREKGSQAGKEKDKRGGRGPAGSRVERV